MVILVAVLLSPGFFALQPNEARVLILFGDYRGTVKQGGFCWGNPFYSNGPATQSTGQSVWSQGKNKGGGEANQEQPKKLKRYKLSLRARNLNGERLKVNDKRGNPIEIAAVIVWQVQDTFSRSSRWTTTRTTCSPERVGRAPPGQHLPLRLLGGGATATTDHAARQRRPGMRSPREELQERLARAGVKVIEARLRHLAYAPEIAEAMLRRQQAAAIIAARQKIVEGAVSMVEMALEELQRDRTSSSSTTSARPPWSSNLLVVLCGENAGPRPSSTPGRCTT